MTGPKQPDMVILSSSDLVGTYAEQGLVEPLDHWIEATGVDLEEFYPAPLGQCRSLEGAILCLPWGSDVDVQALPRRERLLGLRGLLCVRRFLGQRK